VLGEAGLALGPILLPACLPAGSRPLTRLACSSCQALQLRPACSAWPGLLRACAVRSAHVFPVHPCGARACGRSARNDVVANERARHGAPQHTSLNSKPTCLALRFSHLRITTLLYIKS
jgi:hypothetical protein